MLIIAIAWIYVVLMMAITEHSVIAGVMTFLLYGVFPLSVILYLISTPQRKRRREWMEKTNPASSGIEQQQDGLQIEPASKTEMEADR